MKKSITILTIAVLFFSLTFISAVVPEDMTWDEYKKAIEDANSPGFFGSFMQSITGGGDYWGECGSWYFPYSTSECNPCVENEVASNCFYGCYNYGSPYSTSCCYDMVSCALPWCCGGMNVIKTCYCMEPSTTCSGGADPGEKKCDGDILFVCSNSGAWEIDEYCDYTCENTQCTGECNRDSDCGNDGYLGSEYCKNENVYQKYRTYDCSNYQCDYSEEEKLVEECGSGEICQGGECILECQTKTCSQLEKECGIWDNGCGENINCGSCLGEKVCVDGTCQAGSCTPDCSGKECGSDGCEGTCGTCELGELCAEGICTTSVDCTINADCKSLAEVVCDDESLWYGTYQCVFGECEVDKSNPPKTCIAEPEEDGYFLQIAIAVIVIFFIGLTIFAVMKGRKGKRRRRK